MSTKNLLAWSSVVCLFIFSGAVWSQSGSSDKEEFSETNRLLFFENHLKTVKSPMSLVYAFDKKSTFEGDESFSDTIKVNFVSDKGDRKSATVDYFTGDRKRFAPEFNDVIGNPILTIALQRDIYQMERMLNNGTGWRHFQKRLKVAFEESAEIIETEVDYGGNRLPAKDIVVQPYLTDPMSKRFPAFKNKMYVFTISDQVPGSFYRILAQVDKTADGHALTESYTISDP